MNSKNSILFSLLLLTLQFFNASSQCDEYGVWQLAQRVGLAMTTGGSNIDHIVDSIDDMASKISIVAEDTSLINEDLSILETTLDAIKEDFQSIFEKLEDGIEMLPTPISSAPYTISSSGIYALNTILTDTLTIDADDVMLDLNGYSILNSTIGIHIIPGHNNIVIKNGFIDNMTDAGIFIDGNCFEKSHNILLENIISSHCNSGVLLTHCLDINIQKCMFSQNENGLKLIHVSNAVIDRCVAQANTYAGYSLIDCSYNNFRGCAAIGSHGNADSFGVYSIGGIANAFSACDMQGAQSSSTTSSDEATGLYLEGDFGSMATSCLLAHSYSYSPVQSYGIHAPSTQLLDLKAYASPAYASSVSWSACGEFLANGGIGTSDGLVIIYGFDGSSLQELDSVVVGDAVQSVEYSPTSNYLAVGGIIGGQGMLKIYDASTPTPGGITEVASATIGDVIYDINWSSDGSYIAAAGENGGNGFVAVYEFIPPVTLNFVDSYTNDDLMQTVAWALEDSYFLTGGKSGLTGKLREFSFDGSSISFIGNIDIGENILSIDRAPESSYFAAIVSLSGNEFLDIFTLNNGLFVPRYFGQLPSNASVVSWSPYGSYLAINGSVICSIYQFSEESVHLLKNVTVIGSDARALAWRNNGAYLAIGYRNNLLYPSVDLYSFVLATTMTQNLCHNISAGTTAIGLDASSISLNNYVTNAIWNNRAYDNGTNFGIEIENIAADPYDPLRFDNISL